jgi:hypothetical protein
MDGSHMLALSSPLNQRVSSYDNALVVLYLLRQGARAQAAAVLRAIAALQSPDGSVPFSFEWPRPDSRNTYVRSGATAWVGYAAVEYLNAEAGGPAREIITQLAHRAAGYLLSRQKEPGDDPRADLVLGGFVSYSYELNARGELVETYTPGEIDWASTEHNIDAFFFLRDLGHMTQDARFTEAAARIRGALLRRGWSEASGQLVRGFGANGVDAGNALDCASWGSLFLVAAGDALRAETAFAAADVRYAAQSMGVDAKGHRPYAHVPVFEHRVLAERMRAQLPQSWDAVQAVWPEGSAGVALAALRNGRVQRAREILAELEKLRTRAVGLPMLTVDVPGEFDTNPNLAGTIWVELVRFELNRDAGRPTFWHP